MADDMHIAIVEPGSYLDFANLVPFTDTQGVIERGVLNEEGRISSRAQAAVHPLSPADFSRIINLGLDDEAPLLPRVDEEAASDGFAEEQTPFEFEQDRDRATFLASRIVRDRLFRRVVLRPMTNAVRLQVSI